MKPKVIFFGSDQYSQIVLDLLKKDQRWQIVKSLEEKPDVGILASYGQILKKEVLEKPKHGILNIHPSLLPKYRGPTPVPTAILNGEQETGVTIFKMDEKIDHGPILSQFKEEIRPNDTAESLLKRLFLAGAKVLTTILLSYLEGKIELREQDDSQATPTKKFTREDGKINWQEEPAKIERKIRAFYPWPETWTEVTIKEEKKRLKILKAHLENNRLILDQVQLESKKAVTYKQFKEGYPEAKIVS
ncbi:MAG TPA: methionyl-tRNA formyltransferase [Patescibacteria group bacterium]|nr:methionyl-tRNA formyltransferase [Patescibacteria group bacterium]